MDSTCKPSILWTARGRKFECQGPVHKPLIVRLPRRFEEPERLEELHDRYLECFPNGGMHSAKEAEPLGQVKAAVSSSLARLRTLPL